MIKLTKKNRAEILQHAAADAPNEACGLLVMAGRKQVYLECDNVAAAPHETFEIDAYDWMSAADSGEIVAVVHSHPMGGHYLSGADRQTHARSDLPWLLVAEGEIHQYRACPHLRGRVFDYGKADCGTLVRDAFMLAGIDLPDHARTEIAADAAGDYWRQHLTACGFKRVSDGLLQAGDVILTAHGEYPDHASVYLGGGEILHHAYGQLSRREPYRDYWQDHTHSVWRLPQWRPEMMQAISNDLAHAVAL